MEVVNKDIASKDIALWLDVQGITEQQRLDKGLKSNIGILTMAVENGFIRVEDGKTLVQKLKFPFGKEEKISELKYKNELTVGDVSDHKRSIPIDDDNRDDLAILAASTGLTPTILKKMNYKDFNISLAAIPFFVV